MIRIGTILEFCDLLVGIHGRIRSFVKQLSIFPRRYQIRERCRPVEPDIAIVRNLYFPFFSAFGSDQNHTVRSTCPVNRRRRSIFQD